MSTGNLLIIRAKFPGLHQVRAAGPVAERHRGVRPGIAGTSAPNHLQCCKAQDGGAGEVSWRS